MKLKECIKLGVGSALVVLSYQTTLGVYKAFAEGCFKHCANDEEFMTKLKQRDPDLYEGIKKYRIKKCEES